MATGEIARYYPCMSPQVEVSGISRHGIWLFLGDSEAFLSLANFPWFREASVGGVLHVERPEPNHLYWPELDIDLEVDSILHPERYPLIARERPRKDNAKAVRTDRSKKKIAKRKPTAK